MTASTTARTRMFFLVACFNGSMIAACQATDDHPTSGTTDSTSYATPLPGSGSSPPSSDTPSSPDTAPESTPDAPSGPDAPSTPTDPASPETPAEPETPSGAATFPSSPIKVRKNEVVTLQSGSSDYYLVVPDAYDASHDTASSLFIWLHGCGGYGVNDAKVVSPGGSQSWITVSVGGREGDCWTMDTDTKLVLAALDDVKKRVNIDPRRVTIGGYSSGGNLAYRTAFYNAGRFAGILAENTGAFYGTNSSQSASIKAAAWKLNIVHLAHSSDTTYKIATVRSEIEALKAAGFPATLLEQPGTHWDSATNPDLQKILLPYLDAGWRSPD